MYLSDIDTFNCNIDNRTWHYEEEEEEEDEEEEACVFSCVGTS